MALSTPFARASAILAVPALLVSLSACSTGDPVGIEAAESSGVAAEFDLLSTTVARDGDHLVFSSVVVGDAASTTPQAVGELEGAPVWSYVWPTSLNSSSVGFDADQGILALAVTSHPDFDDTPLWDEDGDGDPTNDGAHWHAHWVVLVESADCGGGLSVKDIPEGETPAVPETWPGLPLLLDSPDLQPEVDEQKLVVRVETASIGATGEFSYDGVTSGLRVSTSPHDPLLCVENVFDVASGDLSLPGTVE